MKYIHGGTLDVIVVPMGRGISCTELSAPIERMVFTIIITKNKKNVRSSPSGQSTEKKMRKISLLKAPDVVWVISPYYYTTVMVFG